MGFVPTFHPSGRSVWLGKDLAQSEDWIFTLPATALAEIDENVARLRGRDAYGASVTVEQFPLASIAASVDGWRAEIATGRGFVVIRGLDKERYSDQELGLIFRGFGAHFGRELTQSFLGDRLGDIRDISDEIPERNMRRGYHSGGFQTAHTDPSGELDIVAMLSLAMAKSGGESLLCSAHAVHNMMLDWCPEFLEIFYDGFVLRRPDSDAAAMRRPALIGKIPGFVYENGWLNCDHQNGYIRRAEENGNASLSPKQRAALSVFTALSNHADVMLKMMLRPGDFQFVNNRIILHGRAAFEDHPEKSRRRHLYRLWLGVPEWPRMPAQQGTLWAADMARWDEQAARKRTAAPA
jgi:hypothetical protein